MTGAQSARLHERSENRVCIEINLNFRERRYTAEKRGVAIEPIALESFIWLIFFSFQIFGQPSFFTHCFIIQIN